MEKFVCTHCDHHFESEPAENLVCPNCYWSTSVKKEQTSPSPEKVLPLPKKEAPLVNPFTLSGAEPERPWLWVGGVLFILFLAGIAVWAVGHLRSQDKFLQKIKTENAKVIAANQPELALGPEERALLAEKVPVLPVSPLTEKESQVLAPRMPLRSRLPQGLSMPPWDSKQFEEFLKGIQVQYQLPLEWSYRRKLLQLFRNHYLTASAAFEAKEFLKARDEWIRSLAFPVYRNDLQKHRGVVLTMLRPYINDVLSKIGAMNIALRGGSAASGEQAIQAAYQALQELIAKESWDEANAKILEISKLLDRYEPSPSGVVPPPLPKETALVEPDIQEVLIAQTAPAPSAVPDLAVLRADLTEKEKVIQSRLPEALEAVQKRYDEAIALIKNGNVMEAKEILKKIEYPKALAQDARAKVRILDKITRPPVDSQEKSE